MGKKLNLMYRQRLAKRLAKQRCCIYCNKKNSPSLLIEIDGGSAHRDCAKAATMTWQEIRDWWRDHQLGKREDPPPLWAELWARNERDKCERREIDKKAHLEIRDFWLR